MTDESARISDRLDHMESPAQLIFNTDGNRPAYCAVGDIYTILASGEQTGRAYTLLEVCVPPGGGPPPHLHRREDESFYILEGEMEFWVEGRTTTATAGSFMQMPRGTPHAFKNKTTQTTRMLVLCVPAGFDDFMKAFATPLPSRNSPSLPPTPAEIEKLLALAPQYGIEILPSPAA